MSMLVLTAPHTDLIGTNVLICILLFLLVHLAFLLVGLSARLQDSYLILIVLRSLSLRYLPI